MSTLPLRTVKFLGQERDAPCCRNTSAARSRTMVRSGRSASSVAELWTIFASHSSNSCKSGRRARDELTPGRPYATAMPFRRARAENWRTRSFLSWLRPTTHELMEARSADRRRALEAELRPGGQLRPAVRAPRGQRRRALQAELRLGRVLLLAPGTLHAEPPVHRTGVGQGESSARCSGRQRAFGRSPGCAHVLCSHQVRHRLPPQPDAAVSS